MIWRISFPETFYTIIIAGLLLSTNLVTAQEVSSFIVHGDPTEDIVPYQVSLQIYYQRKWLHMCGASIIAPRYVLTAAHCLEGLSRIRKRILVGTRNLMKGGLTHKVASYKIHPNYKEFKGNDIALVKLAKAMDINNRTISMVNYEQQDYVSGGIEAIFTGWGKTENGFPKILQSANFVTITNNNCSQSYVDFLSPIDICAFCKAPSCSALNGDSGGPLVIAKQNLQIGLLSYGFKYEPTTKPNIFTRISPLVSWIKENIE